MGRIKNAYHRFKSTVQDPVFKTTAKRVVQAAAAATVAAVVLDVGGQKRRDKIDAQNDAYFNNNDSSFEHEEPVQDNG